MKTINEILGQVVTNVEAISQATTLNGEKVDFSSEYEYAYEEVDYHTERIYMDVFPTMKQIIVDAYDDESFFGERDGIPVFRTLGNETIITTSAIKYPNKWVYVPIIPRDTNIATIEDVLALPVQHVQYSTIEQPKTVDAIVSRHEATTELLQNIFGKDVKVFDGNVTIEDIKGKVVAGMLPPFLMEHVESCTSVSIKNYDRNIDGDLNFSQMLVKGYELNTIRMEVE